MTSIEFNRTSNVFLNTGIIALHHYLEMCAEDESLLAYPLNQSNFNLEKDKLTINHDNLFQLLEDVYYLMGKEVYDTATNKQREELGNVFYVEETDSFERFPKIYTLGLTNLITNNAQGGTREETNTIKLEELKKKKPEVAEKIETYFADNKLTILSKIYFNEPYTKITRLDKPNKLYFEPGKEFCYLTGGSIKKLVDNQNTSPFFSGLLNFNSYLKGGDKKISWKAMYLSRFAPKFCLYMYVSGLDSIVCYLFESGNLEQLQQIYNENRSVFKSKLELLDANYMSNFKFHNFNYRKDNENKLTLKSDYTEQAEISFMLIYTIYRQILFNQGVDEITDTNDDFDPMSESSFKKLPVSLVSFRADKFAATLRPNAFEYFNNFKFAIRLISYLERKEVSFQQALGSLKFLKPSEKTSKNSCRLERQTRNRVLKKILDQKSILADIETLFFQCFTLMTSGENVGFKNFHVLLKLVELYQPIIYSKDNNNMKEETEKIQEKAIKFGSSIGISIIGYENANTLSEKQSNAKNGRAYIISLHKSRTLSQFTEAVIRLQKKYNIIFSGELLNNINEENFEMVRQFAIISALNQINSVLKNTQP
ncbi:MAG: hypothetical protein JWR87_3545 [Segetibacter sp.]|nr:hypothetical protein [Segetibacter sp.]